MFLRFLSHLLGYRIIFLLFSLILSVHAHISKVPVSLIFQENKKETENRSKHEFSYFIEATRKAINYFNNE